MSAPFYVTTPIYYPNGVPHIGSTYTTSCADTFMRYHRATGEETLFLTGMDEYGEKISEVARAEGLAPREHVDRMAERYRTTWDELGFQYDRFIRTTDEDHHEAVAHFLRTLYDRGEIEFREYTGLYCVGCERYLTERDLDDGKCSQHETVPEPRSESNYFFKMSAHFDWWISQLGSNPQLVSPDRYRNEVLSLVKSGALDDLCISRPRARLDWGIPIPWDDDYVTYVWTDALVNYLTGAGYPNDPGWEERWSGVHHVIGKDILKPHAIFWPTMLHAAGVPTYQALHVHGYWNMDNVKISKTLGNLVDPLIMKEKYGFEAFRYYLLREMSFGLDTDFSENGLIHRVNADLANDLGNLLNRSVAMLGRYFEGTVPAHDGESPLRAEAERVAIEVDRHVRAFSTQRALASLWELVSAANKYIDAEAPWQLAKKAENRDRLATVMGELLECVRVIAVLLESFLPEASGKILQSLGDPPNSGSLAERLRWGQLAPATTTRRIDALFPRIEAT